LTPKFSDKGELLKCSFCGKSQKQVKKLIAGPGAYICDACIALCNEIISEELIETQAAKAFEKAAAKREDGPACPECRARLAASAVLRKLEIPMEDATRGRTILFLVCTQCGATIDELLQPEGAS
jgi:hypothetical protein